MKTASSLLSSEPRSDIEEELGSEEGDEVGELSVRTKTGRNDIARSFHQK